MLKGEGLVDMAREVSHVNRHEVAVGAAKGAIVIRPIAQSAKYR